MGRLEDLVYREGRGNAAHQYRRKVCPVLGAVAAKIVAEMNGQEAKLVEVQGTFPWHRHDEVFLVWRGRFRVEFRDRIVELGPGELVVVPRGAEHRTAADEEAEVIVLEPAGVLNTGNVIDETFTAPMCARI
jgi:mannose-6-phosphate isomerase-like protein (cupin superfamily)